MQAATRSRRQSLVKSITQDAAAQPQPDNLQIVDISAEHVADHGMHN